MNVKLAVQRLVDANTFSKELESREYYFQKLADLYDQFLRYDVTDILQRLQKEVIPILEDRSDYFETKTFLPTFNSDPALYNFLILIVKMDTYIDEKAYNKKQWNEYEDKRRLSKPQTPMPYAIKFLIWLKISPERLPSNHIFVTCLNYLRHPDKNTIIMSNDHKQSVASFLWNGSYNMATFFEDMEQWFRENIKYKVVNSLNEPIFWSHAMYHRDIKPLWIKNGASPGQNGEEPETEIINSSQYMPALNTILYGPPGTGKTYLSIERAIALADYSFYESNKDNREALNERFRKLLINFDNDKPEGQIAFCTFHQSMSYEDFIEGIKPEVIRDKTKEADGFLNYEVKDGILKILARMASDAIQYKGIKQQNIFSLTEEVFGKAIFYKMSLGNTQQENDEEIFDYCMENNCIALGWGGSIDYSHMDQQAIFNAAKKSNHDDFSPQQVNMFVHYLKTGNYVIVSNGNYRFRAIGKITGDYEYKEESPIDYHHFRNVVWLLKDIDLPVSDIYERNFQQQTLYKLKQDQIKKDFFVKQPDSKKEETKEPPNFVLIIDEINRGNVSQIFGELITLLEEDKRAGKEEALTITLPYSKKSFSVPSNLYLIGTMNTADRSVEALDTALRRRFVFEEKTPDITKITESPEGLSLSQLLSAINKRLETLLSKDHTIGHAWFMGIGTLEKLQAAFKNRIFPLLQEFFYNDYTKIGLVLGDPFIGQIKVSKGFFAKFKDDNELAAEYEDKVIYTLKDPYTLSLEDFKSVYE